MPKTRRVRRDLVAIQDFEKVLKQRNSVLKQAATRPWQDESVARWAALSAITLPWKLAPRPI